VKVAIVNLGEIVSGDWRSPFVVGDSIITDDGKIVSVGTASPAAVEATDVVIDAGGMTAIPGLIDSHVHITFGDYTPRQRTVGYLESYLHGGVTTSISASEVHVPGRPRDVEVRGDLPRAELAIPHEPQDGPAAGLGDGTGNGLHGRTVKTYLRKCQVTESAFH